MSVRSPAPSTSPASEPRPSDAAASLVAGDAELRSGDFDVLLYDGVCALCNGLVRFLVARDRDRRFRYAALQSEFARAALAPYREDPSALSTVFLLQSFGRPHQRCLRRSRAALAAVRRVGGGWGLLARVLSVLPTFALDAGYRLIARVRYRTFGRYDSCPLPPPEHRDLFIDAAARSIS